MKCSFCGSLLTKGMKVYCEFCGEPVPKIDGNRLFYNEMKLNANPKYAEKWDSLDQKSWVLEECKHFGLDPNHPGIRKQYKHFYNIEFGI
jgi:hypothetical protein